MFFCRKLFDLMFMFLGARYEPGVHSCYWNIHGDWSSFLCFLSLTKELHRRCKWQHVKIKFINYITQFINAFLEISLENNFLKNHFFRIFWTISTKVTVWPWLRRYSCSFKWWLCSHWSCTCCGFLCSTLFTEPCGRVCHIFSSWIPQSLLYAWYLQCTCRT